MEGILALRCELSSTEALQILSRSDSNDGRASDVRGYPPSFQDVAIVKKVGQGHGY